MVVFQKVGSLPSEQPAVSILIPFCGFQILGTTGETGSVRPGRIRIKPTFKVKSKPTTSAVTVSRKCTWAGGSR